MFCKVLNYTSTKLTAYSVRTTDLEL